MSSKAKLKASSKEQKFLQYCKDTMPMTIFNSLENKLKVSRTSVYNYLQKPSTMPYDVLKAFARMLGVNPIHLHLEYDAGLDRITAREYQDMIADHVADYNAEQQQKEVEEETSYTGPFDVYLNKLKNA